MIKVAKLCALMALCLCALTGYCQVAVISGQVIDQNGQPLPNAQVRVCSVTSTGVPCSPTTPIFQDYGLTVPAANPWTSDQYGNYTLFAGTLPAPNLYTVQFSPTSGVVWSYVVNGPFLSASGGTISGPLFALSYNGVPEADQCSGSDGYAKINTCAAMIPNGGFEDARGFGSTPQTVVTPLTALATPTRPITLELNPATVWTLNQTFSPGSIAAGTACIVPIAQGSAIITPGGNELNGTFRLGPLASTYDVVCNANQDGTEQSFQIDGLSIEGNASATMKGSLLHIVKTFSGTRIENTNVYEPFGNGVTVTGGGPYEFFNDNFADAYTGSVTYPGAVLTLNCTTHALFEGGSIQDNGLHNPLIVANNCLTSDGVTPTTGLGLQNVSPHFLNTYYEAEPATVGSFSGAATNVDPFQFLDPWDVKMDGATINGNSPTGQTNLFDLLSSGANGQVRGPVEIDGITVGIGWAGKCLINNSAGAGNVSPTLACVKGQQDASGSIGVGKYRWAGSGANLASSTDYEDYKVFSSMNALLTNGDINPALETGSDIGAQINTSAAACTFQCDIRIPPGSYTFSTTITLPTNVYGTYSLKASKGASLTYTGSGDAISLPIGPAGAGQANLIIEGFTLTGNSSAQSGIHMFPTNRVTVRNMLIKGFTNGDGIRIEGTDSSNVYDNDITGNLIGVHLIPTFCTSGYPYTCNGSLTGNTPFAANLNTIQMNQVANNFHWGIWDDRNGVPGGNTGSLKNIFAFNDMELNGSCVGCTQYGAMFIMKSTGDVVEGNYFEGSPSIEVLLGEAGAGLTFAANGAVIRDNYFTTSTIVPYNVELANANGTTIEGNSELIQTSNSSNCFTNALAGGEQGTYIGKNFYVQGTGTVPGNATCVAGVSSPITGTGSFRILNTNYIVYLAYRNFNTAAVTSETIPIQGANTGSSCFATPRNASAAASTGYYISAYVSGGVVFTHANTANMAFDIQCSSGPYS